jgi:PhzF family phenazine biosynthesis protein
VLFDDARLTLDALLGLTAPVHVIEGSRTSSVDHAIRDVVRQHVPHTWHTLIEGAGHMMPPTHPKPLTRALLIGSSTRAPSICQPGAVPCRQFPSPTNGRVCRMQHRKVASMPDVLRLAAFTDRPDGGNPAGVVLDARGMTEPQMQALAAEVGYSETAFVAGARVRYFSPMAEVPFCGHATIAAAVALGSGTHVFTTNAGEVVVEVADGVATLTSVLPRIEPAPALTDVLAAFALCDADLDPALPPRVAFAGARHLILALRSRARLAAMAYDFERLRSQMAEKDWTTVALVVRRDLLTFDARNAFAVGGIVEDPATGAAAAAFGAYLRKLRLVEPPATVTIHQGDDLGRPSVLTVGIDPAPDSGIRVSGTAVAIA